MDLTTLDETSLQKQLKLTKKELSDFVSKSSQERFETIINSSSSESIKLLLLWIVELENKTSG